MNIIRYLSVALICCGALALASCAIDSPLAADSSDEASTNVVPLPEADQQYTTAGPIDTIVVDKNGNMTETQYNYDPDQGGVVINNYDEVAGPDASLFFPAFEVGLLWWGGYWTDHEGYYWNGNHYIYNNDVHWHDNWDHYWHNDWNNKWNQYRRQNPNAGHGYGHNGGNFNHHHGMNRPTHPPQHMGGGHRGGGRR